MAVRKQRPSKLDPYHERIGILPDKEIAALAGVTPENVRAFRNRRGIPARWRGEGVSLAHEDRVRRELGIPAPPPRKARKRKPSRAGSPASKGAKKVRRSKLDPFMEQVGLLPDKQVAVLAGVTPENVRAFRKRRGIPAGWRGEGSTGSTAEASRFASSGPARRGKLSAHAEQIGILTDARISDLAGTTPGNVRAFRKRHGIPARWRGEGQALPNERAILALEAGLDGSGATAAPVVEDLPPEPDDLPAPLQLGSLEGYAIKVVSSTGESSFVVVGGDIVDAARKAVQGLKRRGIEGKVVEVRFLATALGS